MIRNLVGSTWRGAAAVLAFALLTPACGGAVQSGVAVGKVAEGLSSDAHAAPQGAEVCALQEALSAPTPGGAEKATSESCAKAAKSDQLWHRALLVLGAYGEAIETMASGEGGSMAGQLEAAQTGVRGADWVDVDSAPEQAARTAVVNLVNQLSANASKGDLAATVKAAAPNVKTLCDGLTSYLETQAHSLADIEKEAEKRRAAHSDRRCASLDGKSICVGESMIDRMVYASAFGQIATLESAHLEAHDDVAGFCAAHLKLEAAANAGTLSKDQTYLDVVDAVKSVHRAQPQIGSGSGSSKPEPAPAKK
ncbi:MAG: hypothetical protein ABJE95_27970 [Byssovorax sp.]